MTIIALPSGHEHLANALVRDLGYTKVHVDQPIRDLLLALDPLVDGGVTLANRGASPRLTSKIELAGGDWDKAIQKNPEISRLIKVARELVGPDYGKTGTPTKTVIVGVDSTWQWHATPKVDTKIVVIAGRGGVPTYEPDHVIAEGPVVEQELAIVAYVRGLEQPAVKVTVPDLEVAEDPFD
jgi:hypothetical protein